MGQPSWLKEKGWGAGDLCAVCNSWSTGCKMLEKKLDCSMGQCTGIDCQAQEFVYLGKGSKQERCSQVFKLGRFLYYHLEEGESMEDSVFTHSGPQASV